eukprot:893135-Amphidinium_carterae.1
MRSHGPDALFQGHSAGILGVSARPPHSFTSFLAMPNIIRYILQFIGLWAEDPEGTLNRGIDLQAEAKEYDWGSIAMKSALRAEAAS